MASRDQKHQLEELIEDFSYFDDLPCGVVIFTIEKGRELVPVYRNTWYRRLFGYKSQKQAALKDNVFSKIYEPDRKNVIRCLRQKGIKTAVVTSSNMPKMQSVYRKRPEFKELFDEILTSEDFERSKPDPDCYLKAASRFGAQPEECVVFEDSFNGLKSGRAAGMTVVGLATTNSAEAISPLCDEVIENYINY